MNILKKRTITFITALFVSAVSISGTVCVSARSTTPVTGNGTVTIQQPVQTQTEETTQTQESAVQEVPVPTAVATQQETGVVEVVQAQRASDRKYSSKGFVVLWFFLALLINLVLSFMISNRFYKMSKRENHIHSEIRALRRDLEEKFANSVGGFTEMETDITNSNENFNVDESIELEEPQAQTTSNEDDEVFKQWESKMAKRSARGTLNEENKDVTEENEGLLPSKRKYSPTREGLVFGDSKEESKVDIIKNKAKGIINNIFPFKD